MFQKIVPILLISLLSGQMSSAADSCQPIFGIAPARLSPQMTGALRRQTRSPMGLNLEVPVSSLSAEMKEALINAGLPIESSGAVATKTFPFGASASYLGKWEGLHLFVTANHVYARGAIKVTLGENSAKGPFDVWMQAAGGTPEGWGTATNDTAIFAAIPSDQITDLVRRKEQLKAEARLKDIRPVEFSFDSPAQMRQADPDAQFYSVGNPLYFGTVGDIVTNPNLWPVKVIKRYENQYRKYLIASGSYTAGQLKNYKLNPPKSLGVLDLVPRDKASFSSASDHPGVQTVAPARLLRTGPPSQALPDPDGVQPGSSTGSPFLGGDGNVNYLSVASVSVGGDSGRIDIMLTRRPDGTAVLANYVPFSLEALTSAGLLNDLQNPEMRKGLSQAFSRALDAFIKYSLVNNSEATYAALHAGH